MAGEPSSSRRRTLALQNRSFELGCAIIASYPKGKPLDDPSRLIWRQLIKASTSSSFNLEEADAASSDADFVAKMRIALREAKETCVAIRFIVRCRLEGHEAIAKYADEANQMASIFHAIVKNKRANMKNRVTLNS
jgi:four helix bundle protein